MAPPLRDFGVSPGWIASEQSPDSHQLYLSVADADALYGLTVEEGEVRFAMALIHSYVNRPSLWPEQYEERLHVPHDRQQVLLAARPVLQVLSAAGRAGYGRRDNQHWQQPNMDYLTALSTLGAPPTFTSIDVATLDVYGATGEVWLPAGLFLFAYSEVVIRYLTGFPQMPDRVRAATVDIIQTVRAKGASDRKTLNIGKIQTTWGAEGFLSTTAKQLLGPYVVQSLM